MDTAVKPKSSPRWALFKSFDVFAKDGTEDVYLHRLRIVQTPWFGLYVHDLNLPDADPDPHDHPWNFWSLVLRGGYSEEIHYDPLKTKVTVNNGTSRVTYNRRWNRMTLHGMGRQYAHRITSVLPKTKTLVFVGRRSGEWYFWTDSGPVLWSDYIKPGDSSAFPRESSNE